MSMNNNRGPVEDAQHQQRASTANLATERAEQQASAQGGVAAKNAADQYGTNSAAVVSQATATHNNNAIERSQEIKREEGRDAIPEKKNERA